VSGREGGGERSALHRGGGGGEEGVTRGGSSESGAWREEVKVESGAEEGGCEGRHPWWW